MLMMMPIRRIFSSLAASAALCGLTTEANAQFTLKEPQLPDYCISFDTSQSRLKYPYDAALLLILRRLNAYSGWPDIRNLAKMTLPFDGLCPEKDSETPIELKPKMRSVAVSVAPEETKELVDPNKLAFLIHTDQYPVAGLIVGNLGGLASQSNGPSIMDENDSMSHRVVLMTALRATIISEQILYGIEMATRYRQRRDLEFSIERFPKLQNEIFMLMMQSGVAETQDRRLGDDDKTAFRQAVFTALLRNVDLRTDIVESWAKEYYQDIHERGQRGLLVKSPDNRKFNLNDIREKLYRFPGHLSDTEFLKVDYPNDWQAWADDEPITRVMEFLQTKSDMINAAIRNNRTANSRSPD